MRVPIETQPEFEAERQRAVEDEVTLVVLSMNRFPRESKERNRMRDIWMAATYGLREGVPPGDPQVQAAWDALVVECRGKVQ